MAMNRLKEMATSVSQSFAHFGVFHRSGALKKTQNETTDSMMSFIGELKTSYHQEPSVAAAAVLLADNQSLSFTSALESTNCEADSGTTILDLGHEEPCLIDYEDILEF